MKTTRWVIQWYKNGEWYKENWRYEDYSYAERVLQRMMHYNENIEAGIIEKVAPQDKFIIQGRYGDFIDTTTPMDTYGLYVDWDREEKRARIRHKQLKRIKLG